MSPPSYSAQLYFYNLEFPDVRSMVHLVGKSNFYRWHAGIQPVLLSNAYSSNLILGTWTEPSGTPCPNPTPAGVASVGHDRDEWLAANTATCRFIRATLAMNVTPFVRQYKTAKTLFFNLVWLYGKDAGIDSQGGPPVPTNTEFWNPQKGRENLLAALEAKRAFDFLPPVQSAVPFPPRPSIPWVEVVRDGGASSCLLPRTTFTPVTTAITTTTTTKTANSPSPTIVTSQESDPEASDTPLTVVRILERTRVSPSPSLQTIHEHEHEEPHPGRRVPSGHIVDFDLPESVTDRSRGSVSPLSPSEASGVDDDDDDDVSHSTTHCPDIILYPLVSLCLESRITLRLSTIFHPTESLAKTIFGI